MNNTRRFSLTFALSCALLTLTNTALTNTALADPAPGAPKPLPPVGIFCIQPTLMEDIGFGDTRIVFEMVNWTHDVADGLNLTLLSGLNQTTFGTSIVGAGFTVQNDWTFASAANPLAIYSIGGGTPIANIDLTGSGLFGSAPFLNPFNPLAPDSGFNTRRGFEVIVNDWGPSERLAFSWALDMQSLGPDPDGFDIGTWVMDRSSDPYSPGSLVKATTWEQPLPNLSNGFGQINFASNPLDPALTDLNAITFDSPVPEPSSAALLAVGLMFFGSRRRTRRAGSNPAPATF